MAVGEKPNWQTEQRIGKVAVWLAQGFSRSEIVRKCSEIWNVSDRQASAYLQRAQNQVEAATRETREGEMRRHLVLRRLLSSEAWDAGDLKTALAALRDHADLLGLYREKATHDVIDPDQLADEIARAVAAAGGGVSSVAE